MKRFFLALALVLAVSGVAAAADDRTPVGTWSYNGSGFLTGYVNGVRTKVAVTDQGRCVAGGNVTDGEGTVTSASFIGTMTATATGQTIPYNYPWTGSARFKSGVFAVLVNGVTYEFAMTNNQNMSIHASGAASDTGYAVSMEYTAVRTTATPTSAPSSGGGGCSVGFSPLFALLALPLILQRK